MAAEGNAGRRVEKKEEFRASERDLLLPIAAKGGKSARRNLRFLHLRARYAWCKNDGFHLTITQNFLFRSVNLIVSVPAPLPLNTTSNSAVGSTVDTISGSGAEQKSIRHKNDTIHFLRPRGTGSQIYNAKQRAGSFETCGFKQRFWLLLPLRAKVTRPGGRSSPLARASVKCSRVLKAAPLSRKILYLTFTPFFGIIRGKNNPKERQLWTNARPPSPAT